MIIEIFKFFYINFYSEIEQNILYTIVGRLYFQYYHHYLVYFSELFVFFGDI